MQNEYDRNGKADEKLIDVRSSIGGERAEGEEWKESTTRKKRAPANFVGFSALLSISIDLCVCACVN